MRDVNRRLIEQYPELRAAIERFDRDSQQVIDDAKRFREECEAAIASISDPVMREGLKRSLRGGR